MKALYSFYIILTISFVTHSLSAQYKFTIDKKTQCTPVKNQEKTGTCWSFATASFLESELIRKGGSEFNLSEMYVVRNIYKDKAQNYVLRQGKANFSQGSLSHDLIRSITKTGIIPEKFYSGMMLGDTRHDHSEMERGLKGFLDGVIKKQPISKKWKPAFEGIVDSYMGEVPESFEVEGQLYSPQSFAKHLDLDAEDYISISSFTHHPFYDSFILEIPDNYSNGSYHNIPINELEELVDFALIGGYSVAWDGDVSEKGFSARNGMAILPKDNSAAGIFDNPVEEIDVTQEVRQEGFESYSTTDDHLMHLIGIALDQNGTKYYIVKNSWGEISSHQGYLYMSESYFRMKTISIMVNKGALPLKTSQRLLVVD